MVGESLGVTVPSPLVDVSDERLGVDVVIPEGWTGVHAVRGCAELVTEIDEQFDMIATAVGTGGTLAGLAAGLGPGSTRSGSARCAVPVYSTAMSTDCTKRRSAVVSTTGSSTTTITTAASLAEPRRVHVAADDGSCNGCRTQVGPQTRWPCTLHGTAVRASSLARDAEPSGRPADRSTPRPVGRCLISSRVLRPAPGRAGGRSRRPGGARRRSRRRRARQAGCRRSRR